MRFVRCSAHFNPLNEKGTLVTDISLGKVECCSNVGTLEVHHESTQSFHNNSSADMINIQSEENYNCT